MVRLLRCPAQDRELESIISMGPLQLSTFCDSVILTHFLLAPELWPLDPEDQKVSENLQKTQHGNQINDST